LAAQWGRYFGYRKNIDKISMYIIRI